MKNLFVSVFLALAALLFGQSSYETAMEEGMAQMENANSAEEFQKSANLFDKIATAHADKWEPRYYAILSKSLNAFYLPKDQALENVKEIELDYKKLKAIKDNDETQVLRGMFLTVKVAKDPMTYGQSLTPVIMSTYHLARKENPKNPRVLFQIAEYEISGAPYMGQDPKDFCPLLEEALMLFEEEAKTDVKGFEPRWGMDRAKIMYTTTCTD